MRRQSDDARSRRGGLKFFILGALAGATVAGLLRERPEEVTKPVSDKPQTDQHFDDPAEKSFPMGVDPLSPNAPV
jgi:hypothetical protein